MFRFAATIFVSAFLLFQVQPLIGRFILPWFGGGPSIWTSCMLFFQILLLGGYLYAHLISVKLKFRAQVITHLTLLGISLLFLPISPGESWKPTADQSPLLHILLLLMATVGGPYFVLSSTGPLMQKWFSQTSPGRSPYRLYALSNIGSLLALLSYPFAFEPWLTLRQQVWSWSAAYGVYVALAVWCAVRVWRLQDSDVSLEGASSTEANTGGSDSLNDSRIRRPGFGLMLLWLGLAACSSAMLLATTNQLCIDVATVPFLWVLPLSLYLISFIICFDGPKWYDRRAWGLLLIACCPVASWVISEGADVNITKQVAIYSTMLFACCMTCHGELVSCKPHPKYLTLFYVLVSAGGALGGIFVAVVAPYFFFGYWEYHISLVACCAMTLIAWSAQRLWLRTPSLEFWIWTGLTTINISVVWHYVYLPRVAFMEGTAETVVFGAYALVQFAGLILTGVQAHRPVVRTIVWVFVPLISSGLLLGYGYYDCPEMLHPDIQFKLYPLAFASPIAALAICWVARWIGKFLDRVYLIAAVYVIAGVFCGWLWYEEWNAISLTNVTHQRIYVALIAVAAFSPLFAVTRLLIPGVKDEASRRLFSLGAIYPVVCGVCGFLMRQEVLEGWQAISLMSTTAAALMMEWSSCGFRGSEKPSLGFWFWVPSTTMVLLLTNHLAEIVKSDTEATAGTSIIHTSRNFYGVLRVKHEEAEDEDEDFIPPKNALTHGQIRHGFQFVDEFWKRQPTTYYGRESGIGLAIVSARRKAEQTDQHGLRVGVVGLGTGTIAAYGEDGEYIRFYDINPAVIKLSDNIFTYLKDSPAKTEVVTGDARIVMEREIASGNGQQFDVLAIDAFSSDAIPVHLLTSECGEIYREQIRPGGILAIHISNRFLDLNPISRGLAEHLGWQAVRIENGNDTLTGVFSSTWILLSSRTDLAEDPLIEDAVDPWLPEERVLHWTDDYSGLWQVLTY